MFDWGNMLDFLYINYPAIDDRAAHILASKILTEEIDLAKAEHLGKVLDYALKLWNKKKYKEAVRFACDFRIQMEFAGETNALPVLMLKSHGDLAIDLVQGNRLLVMALVPLLNTKEHIKTAGRLIKQYELDKNDYPDICTRIKWNAVYYYVNSEELKLWRLAEILEEDEEMLGMLLDVMLTKTKGPSTTRSLALELLQRYPQVQNRLRSKAMKVFRSVDSDLSQSLVPADVFGPEDPEALRYPFPLNSIIFLSTESDLSGMDFDGTDVVGFDCEWLPPLISINTNPVSIFQIATRRKTFIVDMLSIGGSPILDRKLTALFYDPGIVKVGMSFEGDMRNLKNSYPGMQAFQTPIVKYADLHTVYKKVFPSEPGRGGLTHISKRFLQRPLCKGEQQSNWEKRPLRLMQMHYAALDSYCEILIWDQMRLEATENGVQLANFLVELKNEGGKGRKKKGKEEGL